jgi:sortase A
VDPAAIAGVIVTDAAVSAESGSSEPGGQMAAAGVPRPRTRSAVLPRSVRLTLLALSVLGALSVWFLFYATVLSGLQEHSDQGRLYDTFRSQLAQETSPIGAPIGAGRPVALIGAPAAGISNLVVVEGTTSEVLRSGPGHRSDSPLPGQVGTSYIYGRSLMFGAPFGRMSHFGAGDTITVTTGQGVFRYRVEDVRHPGDKLPRPLGPGGSRLTLVSSSSEGWRSGWAPDQVVYVDAAMVHGPTSGLPAPIPASVSPSSDAMQGDPNALVPLIFWLEGLAAAAVAVGWSWTRWGRLQTWMVGLPVVLGMLWGASGALSAFLPNLI